MTENEIWFLITRHFQLIERRLDEIGHRINVLTIVNNHIQRNERTIMSSLESITAAVTKNSSAVASAVVLIAGLAQTIRDSATDPVALAALATELDAKAQSLADAVVANTPAA